MKNRIALLILAIMVLSTIQHTGSGEEDPPSASWTFMVYLDADNNLESAGIEDFNEMEKVGSTDDVNILVQMDRWESADGDDTTNGDWKDCKRFRVEKDDDPAIINSPVLQELGEVNMGDPQVLVDFFVWGMENYPAENYAIVFWDHGGGWRGICWDETVPGSDTYDMLNLTEIGDALEGIYLARGGERIELVGFDACLMAQVEVQYEIMEFGSVSCASGFNEPGDGWPYLEVLQPLVERPTMNEYDFGTIIADAYVESYTDSDEDPQDALKITMTAFDLRKMGQLIITLDKFSEELASAGPAGGLNYLTQIYVARKNCNSYDGFNIFIYDLTGYPLYDIHDFTLELERLIPSAIQRNSKILGLCKDVRDALEDVQVHARVAPFYEGEAWGMSMYFPNKEEKLLQARQLPTAYDLRYEEVSYVQEHIWDDFLHAFYGIDPISDSLPSIMINEPDYNHTYAWDERNGQIKGEAYDREGLSKVEVRIDEGPWMVLPGIEGQGQIGWIYNLDLSRLDAGQHLIEFRAHDTLGESTPGHVTSPKDLLITKEDRPEEKEGGIEIPAWLFTGLLIILVVIAFLIGVVILKGRSQAN